MDELDRTSAHTILAFYKGRNPLPLEKQSEARCLKTINHVLMYTDWLSEDEWRAAVATSSYMYLSPADKQAFFDKFIESYNLKKSELYAWERAIGDSMDEHVFVERLRPFKLEDVIACSNEMAVRYKPAVARDMEQMLRQFFDTYPKSIKSNVNYKSIVGAVEYAVIVKGYPELKDFDQQVLADRYEVSKNSIGIWHRNIKKYCIREAWH
ncbi:hypothetical protein HB904_14370 [Listeria booriae]|uniref:Uncharacterized protein n=1 Tax=Listeria booriae TaxID=1552123 RepID=A0A842ANA1_9LIST|nr:hypothetical protein [Listeria booriae]MBC1617388.1 hypothetical protein [Listeria booriae]